jgi:hypothetical protein
MRIGEISDNEAVLLTEVLVLGYKHERATVLHADAALGLIRKMQLAKLQADAEAAKKENGNGSDNAVNSGT